MNGLVFAKVAVSSAALFVSGTLVGTSFGRKGLVLNHPVLAVLSSTMAQQQDDHSLLAVQENKLDQIIKATQAAADDAKETHSALATLTNRVNVDEAEIRAAGLVFGILFSVFSTVSTVLAILEYRVKRRHWYNAAMDSRAPR